jgi:hypothetical protein
MYRLWSISGGAVIKNYQESYNMYSLDDGTLKKIKKTISILHLSGDYSTHMALKWFLFYWNRRGGLRTLIIAFWNCIPHKTMGRVVREDF